MGKYNQLASLRSKNSALFTKFSQQASKTARSYDRKYFTCIDRADTNLTLGPLILCNYKYGIKANGALHKNLWKHVDSNFKKINGQLRSNSRRRSRSSNSITTDLQKQNKSLSQALTALRKETNAQRELINRQADLITGLEQRLMKLEMPEKQGKKRHESEKSMTNQNYEERLTALELTDMQLLSVLLKQDSQTKGIELVSADHLISSLNELGIN